MKEKTLLQAHLHPVDQQKRQLKEKGLVVLDNVTQMPAYNENLIQKYVTVALNHEGFVRGEYDMQNIEFNAREVSVIYPDHIIMARESSHDYRATLVVISRDFYEEIQHRSIRKYKLEYLKKPHFHLTDEQYEGIVHIIETIKAISKIPGQQGKEALIMAIDVFAQMLDYYRFEGKAPKSGTSSGEKLFYKFYDAVVEHYQYSHEVKYYASLMNLSPKYFANVTKNETGTSATDWIAKFLIVKGRSLLKQRDLSIQQVSEALGFPEQSSFSRYFKQHTGITPSGYRKK